MGFLILAIILFVYFLPWIVAASNKKMNRGAIAVLNLLLGWTAIGWVIALVWACMKDSNQNEKVGTH